MTSYQILIVAVCSLVNLLDGYDLFVMGYALPHISDEYATAAAKGYLVSAALFGIGVGAFFLARLADVHGRRPVLIGALILNTAGLLISSLAPNYSVLIVSRFATGMAIGVLGAISMIIAQEMSPPSRRSLSVGVVLFGYPLGTFVAGLAGAAVIEAAGGWKGLFWLGFGLSALVTVVVVVLIPETVAYLRGTSDKAAQEAADKLSARVNLEEGVPTDTGVPAGAIDNGPNTKLLGPGLRTTTLLLWFGYGFCTAAFYFIGSWTPQLIKNETGDAGSGALVGIMLSIGTMIGAILFGLLGLRRPSAQISWVSMVLGSAALLAFALTLKGALALAMALLLGLFVFVSLTAFTAIATTVYPIQIRAKGFGTMLGVARVGSIVSPILGGYAIGFMSPRALYIAVLVPLAIAGLCSYGLLRATRTNPEPVVTLSRDTDLV
ncbi:MAG: MFS transporter permease [Gordonia sp.]|nr:MFS transporter permease [Gordonia sp. (in: high G+C Gram-positive bacteria)]